MISSSIKMMPLEEKIIVLSFMDFGMIDDGSDSGNVANMNRIKQNLYTLKTLVGVSPAEALVEIAHMAETHPIDFSEAAMSVDGIDMVTTYTLYLGNLLLYFANNIYFDTLSEPATIVCKEAIKELCTYSLNYQLHPALQHNDTFRGSLPKRDEMPNYVILKVFVKVFACIFENATFAEYMKSIMTTYMGAILTLFNAHNNEETELQDEEYIDLQICLNNLWSVDRVMFFNTLMIIAGVPHLPCFTMEQLNTELLQKLSSPKGFESLVISLREMGMGADSVNMMHNAVFRCDEVDFQAHMCKQVFDFLDDALKPDIEVKENIALALPLIHDLYKNSVGNMEVIHHCIRNKWSYLVDQSEFFPVGTILMDHNEFNHLLRIMCVLFNAKEPYALPEEALINYVGALVHIYDYIGNKMPQKRVLRQLIIYGLNQPTQLILSQLVLRLYLQRYDTNWLRLHDCLVLVLDQEHNKMMPVMGSLDEIKLFRASKTVPEILLKSKGLELILRVFVILLHQVDKVLCREPNDLSITVGDAQRHSALKDTIQSLRKLAQYHPLKTTLDENSFAFYTAVHGLTWLPDENIGNVENILNYIIGLADMPL